MVDGGTDDDVIANYHMIVRRLYLHALTTHDSIHFSVSFQCSLRSTFENNNMDSNIRTVTRYTRCQF